MQLIIIALVLVLAVPGFAADAPRKIDFTTVIIDPDGNPMLDCVDPATVPAADPSCKTKRALTLGAVAMRALGAPEQGISVEESLKRGQLALMVYHSTGAELTAEEIALIKKRIAGVNFSPLIVARAFPLLDPATGAK